MVIVVIPESHPNRYSGYKQHQNFLFWFPGYLLYKAAVPLCVCVCLSVPPPFFWHDRLIATKFGTHARIDPGIIREQTKFTHPTPRGVSGGILGGQKFQKVREMSWTAQKINKKLTPR